jgi:type IX secretion system PorP/SprF family membrane protein
MKKVLIFIAFVVLGLTQAFAQQVPMYSHYYYNQFLYNPAMAGSKSYGQVYLINRNQWFNIPGAPQTQALTIDGPLRNNNAGLGLGVYRDVAGQFNITGGTAAYRYTLNLGNSGQKLSFGLALGVLNNRIDLNDISVQNPLDPVTAATYQGATGFDANMGVNYEVNNFNIGLAVPQILGGELAYDAIKNTVTDQVVRYGMARQFVLNAGYNWDIKGDETWFLQPNALLRYTPNTPAQYDISAMLNYQDKYWIGGMFRSAYAVTAAAGLRLADQFVAGYAYDISVHKVSEYTKGAHEVMLGYQWGGSPMDDPDLKKKFKDIDDKLNKEDKDIDSLGNEIKKNRKDIDKNTDDIDDNDVDIDEINDKIKTFEQFMQDYKDGKLGSGSGSGKVYTFNNVYFATNKWDIRTEARAELDNLVTILKDNPNLKIEVAGHADQRGSASYNQWLSNKRSVAVRDYLISNGVTASQLEVKGYGEDSSFPTLDENRRVEFKIISE